MLLQDKARRSIKTSQQTEESAPGILPTRYQNNKDRTKDVPSSHIGLHLQ